MYFRTTTLVTLCMGTVAATTALTMSPVSAQSTAEDAGNDLVIGSSQLTTSANLSTAGILSSIDTLGSSDFAVPGENMGDDDSYPLPIDESIVIPEIRNRVAEPEQRLERWTIASPAMSREVDVQILLPSQDTIDPAPMVYLLDGIEAPRRSGWVVVADVDEMFAEENVTLLMPTQANASLYLDWYSDDPALGRMQWETFLTEELPLLLEDPAQGLRFNGHRGIGGLSMGAGAAVHIANRHPSFFDGVFGLSGCYSTTSRAGEQSARLTVESRGASLANAFGPAGSPSWRYHDTPADPEGLRNQRVYLSSARGAVGADDAEKFKDDPPQELLTAIALEQGSNACTRDLEAAMRSSGMRHQVVDQDRTGVHNWANFSRHIIPAWNHIKPALY